MTARREPLSVVRAAPWRAVVARLERAVAAGQITAAERDLIRRPVQLLQAMADESAAALGDDFLAQERLRALLLLSSPWGALVDEARRVLAAFEARKMPPLRYAPGVLHHGALVLVGVAAVRVASAASLVELFARTVHGLALLAAPAEILGRLEPEGPTGDTLAAMVDALVERDGPRTGDPSALRPVQADPVERGRWGRLDQLLGHVVSLDAARPGVWDGGFSTVVEVRPNVAAPGDRVELRLGPGALEDRARALPGSLHVVFAGPGMAPVEARVPPRRSGGTLLVEVPEGVAPGWIGFSDDRRVARSRAFRNRLRNELRSFADEVRLHDAPIPVELIPSYGPDGHPGHPVLACPPRTAANRFYTPVVHATLTPAVVSPGGLLTLRWETEAASEVDRGPAEPALPPSGTLTFPAPPGEGVVRLTLTPVLRHERLVRGRPVELTSTVERPVTIADVVVQQGGHAAPFSPGAPLDVEVRLSPATARAAATLVVDGRSIGAASGAPGALAFTIPGALVRDPLRFTVALDGDGGDGVDRRREVTLRVRRQEVTVVAFRPAIVAAAEGGAAPTTLDGLRASAVSAEELDPGLREAAAAGYAVTVVELPFVEDALAALPRPLESGEDPQVTVALERLSAAAMRTPGLEDALWVMLVRSPFAGSPGPSPRRALEPGAFARSWSSLPAEGARAVAITCVAGLPSLVAETFPFDDPDDRTAAARGCVTTRLRLVGRAPARDRVELETPRVESRAAGPGPRVPTGLVAVALDRRARELSRTPLRAAAPGSPGLVTALVPVTPETTRVEVRRDDEAVLHACVRRARPELDHVHLTPGGNLSWRYRHPDGVVPRLTLELVDDGDVRVTAPFAAVDACALRRVRGGVMGRSGALPLHRVRKAREVWLVASDGWNEARARVVKAGSRAPAAIDRASTVTVRRVGDDGYWADVTGAALGAWRLDGRRIGGLEAPPAVVHVPPWAQGTVAAEAGGVTDARSLGEAP